MTGDKAAFSGAERPKLLLPLYRGGAAAVALVVVLFGPIIIAFGQSMTPEPSLTAAAAVARVPAFEIPSYRYVAEPIWIDQNTGLTVYASIDGRTFPDEWRAESIAASGAPADPAEATRVVRILQVAASKYPASVISANLERIYLLGDLQFQGIHAAGTNSANAIYIKVEPGNPMYSDAFLEESFHHEFAHLLRRNYAALWNADRWAACNPAGFQYGAGSGVEAVREGKTSLDIAAPWNVKGFLNEYATSDISEDFATVGGSLFTGDATIWPLVDQNPALAAKFRLAVAFYGRISPGLTESYFRSLKTGQLPANPPDTTIPLSPGTKAPASPPPIAP